jgi:uncharacterized protein
LPDLSQYDFAAHVHGFTVEGHTILLDVNSGAIHILDPISRDFIAGLARNQGDPARTAAQLLLIYDQKKLQEVWDELQQSIEEQALFTEESPGARLPAPERVKALCLNVAHACNMTCAYCFASQGTFGLKPSLMDLDTGCRAVDFLLEQSGDIRHLEVDFFGGEPLLVREMLPKLVRYARERGQAANKEIHFTLTTNAALLDETVIDFILTEHIGVILSLDGRPEIHDRHRRFPDGRGTYASVLPNIKRLVARGPDSYYIRGTFSRYNKDFANDLTHIVDLGFDCLSLEPAVGADLDISVQEEDLPDILTEYEEMTRRLLAYRRQGRDVNFFHYNLQLQGGPCLAKRGSGCGAGMEYLAVTPEGDLYPCHQLVGEKKFFMGNVRSGFQPEVRQIFAHNQVKDKCCQSCWARYFCGGGCHANAYFKGDIHTPDPVGCKMHQKRIEQAIYLELTKRFSF